MKEVTFHLEVFDGPLDLLLHLLSKNKVEIQDIPIAEILDQYLSYIRQMQEFDLEIASEFITMAAQLMYIKSKMLLPVYAEEPQEDPRAGLVEALLEYQRIREAGSALNLRSQIGSELFVKGQEPLEKCKADVQYSYDSEVLVRALEAILSRAERRLPPPVEAFRGIVGHETVPVDDKIRVVRYVMKAKTKIRGGVRGKDIFVLDKEGYIDALLNKKPSLKRPSSREVFEEHEAEIRQGDYAK